MGTIGTQLTSRISHCEQLLQYEKYLWVQFRDVRNLRTLYISYERARWWIQFRGVRNLRSLSYERT